MEGEMRVHKLQTWPVFFEVVEAGRKRWEYRKNDRGFKRGDFLELHEYNPTKEIYTGSTMTVEVEKVWVGLPGMPSDYCIMDITRL